jgi:hypothetical protein
MLALKMTVLSFIVMTASHQASATEFYRNQIQPFASDGCSASPNGVPYESNKKWLHCCVEHDVSYWKGGTSEEKLNADKTFESCVTKESNSIIGKIMYLGVRGGGSQGGPTSWNWGYGWVVPRGYVALSETELFFVNQQLEKVPKDLAEVPITSTVYFPEKLSITGDYCLDEIAEAVELKIGHGFNLSAINLAVQKTSELIWNSQYTFTAEGCTQPVTGVFYLRTEEGCTTLRKKLTALGSYYSKKDFEGIDSCH